MDRGAAPAAGRPEDVTRALEAVARAGRADPARAAACLRGLALRVRRAGGDRRRLLDRRRNPAAPRLPERRSGADRRRGERRRGDPPS